MNSLAIPERLFLYIRGSVLVLVQLYHSARSCIKIYPFCGNTTHSHESEFHSNNNRRHSRVWHKQDEKYHAKCIQVRKSASLVNYLQQRPVSSGKNES